MPPLSQARCRFHPPGAGKFARNPCQSWGAGKVVTDSGKIHVFGFPEYRVEIPVAVHFRHGADSQSSTLF
jgi:hypothetical protein